MIYKIFQKLKAWFANVKSKTVFSLMMKTLATLPKLKAKQFPGIGSIKTKEVDLLLKVGAFAFRQRNECITEQLVARCSAVTTKKTVENSCFASIIIEVEVEE